MAIGDSTSFYGPSHRNRVPQPSDDPPQGHSDGVGKDVEGDDGADAPRDDQDDADWWHSGSSWNEKSDWWSNDQWGHSWDQSGSAWSSGWGQGHGRGSGHDSRWQERNTWTTSSTGSGSADGGTRDWDLRDSSSGQWGRRTSGTDSFLPRDHSSGNGWAPANDAQGSGPRGRRDENSRGPSERMTVPSFSGAVGDQGDDIGTSARSYLRQISAWRRMTRMSEDQQGLTLYQHLTDKAWIDAERLDVDKLATTGGVDYLIDWIKDRYLDVQVTQIGRSLSGFFRGLHRRANQSVRDYMAEFDRAFARLGEVGCHLPDVAAAWVFVDRMGLEEQAELNLLASVGNQYSLKALQQAAIVHDRGLRKPWEHGFKGPKKEWGPKKAFSANMAAIDEGELLEDEPFDMDGETEEFVSEDVAQDLYQAFMTHATAKQKYKESMKLRGSDPEGLRLLAQEKLKVAKSKSFCAGCKRRGHWHKDAICPLNKGRSDDSTPAGASSGPSATGVTKEGVRANYPCHVVHVTWDLKEHLPPDLLAITDTACSRSVAGSGWIDVYLAEARRMNHEKFLPCREAFRFGASKVFLASYAVILCFELGNKKVALKVAVVNGEVPLLVSRPALGTMGMIIDVAMNRASFRTLGVEDMRLTITDTGHPAFPIQPAALPQAFEAQSTWDNAEIQILSREGQYMTTECFGNGSSGCDGVRGVSQRGAFSTSWMVSSTASCEDPDQIQPGVNYNDVRPEDPQPRYRHLFYPKKIGSAARNALLDVNFNPETFAAWWSSTNISNDFWIENDEVLVRVHVIPRRSFFNPQHWKTQNSPQKESLLRCLGEVRSVNALSCKSHRELPAVHGTWSRAQDESSFPVLWIGRSVFSRRQPMPPSSVTPQVPSHGEPLRSPHSSGHHEGEDTLGVHEARVDCRSPCPQSVDSREVDRPRDQVGNPGGSEEPRPRPSGEHGHVEAHPRPVEDDGNGEGLRATALRDPRDDHADPSQPRWDGAREHLGLRSLQRKDVQGHPSGVSHLGAQGNRGERQPVRGPRDVCQLVARGATPMGRTEGDPKASHGGGGPVRPGDEREGSLCGGRHVKFLLGCVVEGVPCPSGSDHQGEIEDGPGARTDSKDSTEEEDGIGRRLPCPHGAGDPRERHGRGALPGGEAGGLEGPPRPAAGTIPLNTGSEELVKDYDEGNDETYFECNEGKEQFHLQYPEVIQDIRKDADIYVEDKDLDIDEYLLSLCSDDPVNGEPLYEVNMNSGGSGDVIQRKPTGVEGAKLTAKAKHEAFCEGTAKVKLQQKNFEYHDLLEIARLLPLQQLRKGKALGRAGGDRYEYFLGGLFTYGTFHGLTTRSREMTWTVKYINAFMRSKGVGSWSSFVLFKNTATRMHKDARNLRGSTIKTVSFGDFNGGGLWLCDPFAEQHGHQPAWRKDAKGRDLCGYVVDTKEEILSFNGNILHATEPWEGERWTLSCYTTQGYLKTSKEERDELRELRFPLRGIPLECNEDGIPIPPTTHRPPKSTRKNLWKSVGRLMALTTWCTTAASSFLQVDFPISRGPGAVVLFEIGGYEKTIEVTEMDYLAAEPYGYHEEDLEAWDPKIVKDTIEEMAPSVVWLHGQGAGKFLHSILEPLYNHVDKGRQLAIEAPPDHPCWEEEGLKELILHYDQRWQRTQEEPRIMRINRSEDSGVASKEDPEIEKFTAYMAQHASGSQETIPEEEEKRGAEAISFAKGAKISPEVRSSLKRLHQNMGHPSNTDLARHLRLAGADPSVVEACKRLHCQVCHRHQRANSAKPSSLPNLLDFNQIVAVDAFYVYDHAGAKVELMMAIDVGTGFALAGKLLGHSTATMESSFCSLWSNTFGAPGTLILDLESGLQAGLGRFSEWHGTHLRPIAGQAHWQNGSVERAIRTWKEIWVKVVDAQSATTTEAPMVITAVNSAMNTLRRDAGFSPAQAVWGRDPQLPEDVRNSPHDEHVEHIISHDRQRAREHTIRVAAKEAYFKCQNDARLRKGLLQRSRVAGPELHPGVHVFFYRKPKNNKNWAWHGPGTVIGKEGPNSWISFAGRCFLVAPEHTRMASAEELGAAFTARTTKEDLQRLLDQDFGDETIYENEDVEMEGDVALPLGDDGGGNEEPRGDAARRKQDGGPSPHVSKRHRRKGPQDDELPPREYDAYMLKIAKTPRGKEKALEKEIPWSLIPPEQHDNFRQAEKKQWLEHVEHNALEPLSISESRDVAETKGDRILGSRFAYRDKLWSRRRAQPDIGWKPKARLVIAGHKDPDLARGLSTHAPTISRQGIHLLLQILASNLDKGWKGYAGDVTAAFLCGEDLVRELYLRQPRTGLGDLHPEQLLCIRKPIFGLVDSPSAWWTKFKKTLQKLEVSKDSCRWRIIQSTLDHCIFMVQKVKGMDEHGDEILEPPSAYLGVHVDDVLLVGGGGLCELLKQRLSQEFPIQDWEGEKFEYVGSYIEIFEDRVKISQAGYATTRLFEVEVDRTMPDHLEATEVQKHDNQSLIGALSWMACQTRPDLQVGVSMSQQRQKEPTVGDVRFTNQLARRALEHREEGLIFYPVNFEKAVLLCYHDAGWANAPQSQEDPYYRLTHEEDEQGRILDGPYARKDAKIKKANSTIASQFGGLYLLANDEILHGTETKASILDWKSGACERVCRSTFAAETMACCTATETGDFISRFLETLLTGRLARSTSRFKVRFLSDCRSLYDHLTRDGVPRVPTCKRLAIDLAGIREDLKYVGRIVWVPTGAQLADILTKPLKAETWWNTIKKGLRLTFRE